MRMLLFIRKIGDILEKLIKVAVTLSLGTIVVLINVTVYYRYILKSPLSWSTELPELLLVFTVLFAAAPAIRHDMFAKVEAFYLILPVALRKVLRILSTVLITAFFGVCVAAPGELIHKARITGTVSPALGIPLSFTYTMLRLGFATVLFFLLLGFVDARLEKSVEKERRS